MMRQSREYFSTVMAKQGAQGDETSRRADRLLGSHEQHGGRRRALCASPDYTYGRLHSLMRLMKDGLKTPADEGETLVYGGPGKLCTLRPRYDPPQDCDSDHHDCSTTYGWSPRLVSGHRLISAHHRTRLSRAPPGPGCLPSLSLSPARLVLHPIARPPTQRCV